MASAAQYECFRDIFQRQTEYHERLIDRGKLFLSIITLYLGLLGIGVDEIVPIVVQHPVVTAAYVSSFAGFVAALVLVVLSIGIYRHVYPTDPRTVLLSAGDRPPEDADFFDERIAELATAFSTNHALDQRRANLLRLASSALLAGIVCQVVVLCSIVLLARR